MHLITRMLRICDRSATGTSEPRKSCSMVVLLIMWIVCVSRFSSRLSRQVFWAHADGTVTEKVQYTEKGKYGERFVYKPMVSFELEDGTDTSSTTTITFISSYSTWNKNSDKYPVGSSVNVLYNPRNHQDAEISSENRKGMALFGGVAAIMALVVGAMVYSVYCTALEEQRLYPAYYIEHDSDNNGQGEEPRPVV